MSFLQSLTQPLISDLQMELQPENGQATGRRVHLGHSFVLPPGLPGIGQNDSGGRAPDSRFVVRSGDNLPTIYTVTVPGKITAASPTELRGKLQTFWQDLKLCRKLWRGDYAYLLVDGGLLPSPQMEKGWMSCEVAPVFLLAYLGWLDPQGNEVFG